MCIRDSVLVEKFEFLGGHEGYIGGYVTDSNLRDLILSIKRGGGIVEPDSSTE